MLCPFRETVAGPVWSMILGFRLLDLDVESREPSENQPTPW